MRSARSWAGELLVAAGFACALTSLAAPAGARIESERIFFIGRRPAEGRQIFSVRPDGTRLEQWTHSARDKRRPAVSAAAGRLVYSTNRGELWSLVLATRAETLLETAEPGVMWDCPAWSPDGASLVAARQVTVPKDDSQLCLLLPPPSRIPWFQMPGMEFQPAWSPDASRIAYARFSERRGGIVEEALWSVDVRTGQTSQLLEDGADNHHPLWLDSDSLLYVSNSAGSPSLWRLDLPGGKPVQLPCPGPVLEPALSPDAERLAYVLLEGGRCRLTVQKVTESTARTLDLPLEECREPAWCGPMP
ncbi:MAG: PD40 domain-containing protein [Candidatus Wallbacteria bacterium]|nr:PD40 domain-containing protein [Candidatus Wallbacteria bacterium]